MSARWSILIVLFLVRLAMAFQFQAVAALSPLIMKEFSVGLTDVGFLIGLYLAPGIAIAIPGGMIGRRFGEKRVVAFSLLLMIVGGTMMALASDWAVHSAGRLLAGIGGVALNVLMAKMVADWFVGREMATAMGIFVNSWPVGIAAALLFLPLLAETGGLRAALWVTVSLVGAGLILLLVGYRPPASAQTASGSTRPLRGLALRGALIAGAIWGLYNAALGMIFSFGPAMLIEREWTLTAASSTTSIVLWLVAISVPAGGYIADTLDRRDAVMLLGFLSFALLLVAAVTTDAIFAVFIGLGLTAGLAAGPIMSLPSEVLPAEVIAPGIGVFFTLFYMAVFGAPIIAGSLSELSGSADAAFILGAAMLLLCCPLLMLFRSTSAQLRAG